MIRNFNNFFEALQSPSLLLDSSGIIINLNKQLADILGYSKEEITGKTINRYLGVVGITKDLIPFPSYTERFITAPGKPSVLYEIRSEPMMAGEGEYSWLVFKRKSQEKEENSAGISGIMEDRKEGKVPEKKNIKHVPEEEVIKERYRLAVEASQTGVGDYNFESHLLIIDESLHDLMGYGGTPDNSITFWSRIIHPDDRQSVVDTVKKYIHENKTYIELTFRAMHQRRIYLWILCRGKILYNHGQPARIIFSFTDITERIEKTELLNKALVNFKSVFEAFPDLFFRLNKLGDYLEVMAGNRYDLVWPKYEDYEGKNIREALPPEVYQHFYETLIRSFDSGEIESCFYELRINNNEKHFEARIKAISKNEAIVIVRNITESVKNNEELIKARRTAEEALHAKDEFLSTISHEIRTPLNVVVGMTYLLLQNSPREDQVKYINTLKFSSSGLVNMINDLLDLSKIQSGRFELEHIGFNLTGFLNDLYESYQAQFDKRPVEFSMEVDPSVPEHVTGDSKRLAQILNNLLNNASKFTEQGHITLSVSAREGENPENKIVEFIVSDSGIGIQPDKLDMIFEPYVQSGSDIYRKYGGTGLGLAIIKQLLEIQHGSIHVASEVGKGSTFTVKLPMKVALSSDIPENFENSPAQNMLKEKNLKILYADDVASNRFLMEGYFDLWGCTLITAKDGQEAVNKTHVTDFDIILMDLQMPVLDGFRATVAIRQFGNKNKNCPIIAITGDITNKTKKAILDAGFNDILVKPLNPKKLYEMIIQSILGEKSLKNVPVNENNQSLSDPGSTISFRQVDLLYSGVPDQYQQLMEMLVKEYEGYKADMIKALKKGYFDEFRQIRHCMTSNLKLFEMNRLKKLVDSLRKNLEENPDMVIDRQTIKDLEDCFRVVIESFYQKLKALINQ